MDNVAGYEIIKRERVGNREFLLGYNPKAPQPYVTWKNKVGELNPYWGKYFSDEKRARNNFRERVNNEKQFDR